MIGLEVTGDKQVAAALLTLAVTTDARVARKVVHWAHMLEASIKAHAPVRTGDYRRSWTTAVNGMTATVGTNKPQARRLEYGFVGTDSLGRHYNQGPRPHVRPAVDAVKGPFLKDIASVVDT